MNIQSRLREKLKAHILTDHPEMITRNLAGLSFIEYLVDMVMTMEPLIAELRTSGKPEHAIEELCMNEMSKALGPSKFHYIREVMQAEFPPEYGRLVEMGVVTFETICILERCDSVFDIYHFSEETKDSRFLRYAIIVLLHQHFN